MLEHRASVFIERGKDNVQRNDYKKWHKKGLCEKHLEPGLGEEAVKRLCLIYDNWKRNVDT